jgi:F-type H+-transporting ATPase subunit gamma
MNFRQVKKKIKTVKNVKKITNAMQMVSAVKMRKAQQAALEGREYRLILDAILQKVIGNTSDLKEINIPWLKTSEGEKTLNILVTSNKGLCGSFHSNLFKHVLTNKSLNNTTFVTIGQKGAQFASAIGSKVYVDFSGQMPFVDNVSAVFSAVEEQFISGGYSKVTITYNKFISSLKSEPTTEQLLPIENLQLLIDDDKDNKADQELNADYIIEPSVAELLGPLVQDYIKERIRSAITDSEASEHSARMMAMKAATDNAGEVIYSLTLLGNKLRQSQITNELLDMVGAKESSEVN